jgi:hypothetical protein
MSSRDWVTATDTTKLVIIACLLLAVKNDGRVLDDMEYLRRMAHIKSKQRISLKPLIASGFLVPDDGTIYPEEINVKMKEPIKTVDAPIVDSPANDRAILAVASMTAKERDTAEFLEHELGPDELSKAVAWARRKKIKSPYAYIEAVYSRDRSKPWNETAGNEAVIDEWLASQQ